MTVDPPFLETNPDQSKPHFPMVLTFDIVMAKPPCLFILDGNGKSLVNTMFHPYFCPVIPHETYPSIELVWQ